MSQFHKLIFILSLFSLFGCSQKFSDTNATVKEALFGFSDVKLSAKEIDALPYASLYARINDGQQIFMVLALAEENPETGNIQLKWLSADKAMIATENGRVVKTLLLPEANLVNLSSSHQLSGPSTSNANWQALYDWQPGYHYSKKADVTSRYLGDNSINTVLWNKNTHHILETVTFPNTSQSMENEFWVDEQGNVVKSAQWVIPDTLFIELEILKPFLTDGS
ncbi:YjbF family lipoprotein [Vibrio japonicus]|uniref:YjbF family lipoprotein n=1 Tax=Vibrio japonicus TaxID=1824638 RepID=A0ABY5LFW8_9VIBR|nr:YjbF family lipoprotein [Vibrio japonicus]UUM30040.1 YjbF family lipoprotein [Vibrio japonicus]